MRIKTAADLYNSIVDLTKKTGQGTPMFVIDELDLHDELEQLKKLDLVTVTITSYIRGSNLHQINIKNVYCVGDDIRDISFLRRWLKIDQSEDIPFSIMEGNRKDNFNEWKINTKDSYVKWISDNLEKLEAINDLEHKKDSELCSYVMSDIKEGTDIYDYLVSRKWYIDNVSIQKGIYDSTKKIKDDNTNKDINIEIIGLCNKIETNEYRKKAEKCKLEIDLIDLHTSFNRFFISMMGSSNDYEQEKVKDFFNF